MRDRSSRRSTTRIIVVAVTLFAWIGCGGDGETGGENGAAEAGAAGMAQRTADTGPSCVADYEESPCDLLTEEIVRSEVPNVPPEIEKTDSPGGFSMCSYSWPSDRKETRELMDRTFEVEVDNRVDLSSIETYEKNAVDRFRRAYLPTAEELQRGREIMQEEFEKRAEEEGLSETEKEIGEGLADVAMEKTASSRKVDGVGSNASWSGGISSLHVLHGDTKFEIRAEVSADDATNRETAAAVARAVIAACE